MFETAVVRSRAVDRRFSWLSLSLAVHSAAIAAVLATSIASSPLPVQAPKLMIPFMPAVAPPPALGTPNPAPARPRAAAPATAPRAVAPIPVMAPRIIPDAITPVAPQSALAGPATTTGPIGPDIGNDVEGPSSTAIGPDAAGPLPIANGVKAPTVIRRVEPIYPMVALRARMNGSVVLQCIIDKSGTIRDVHVMSSTFAAFEQPAIDAVQQWLFAPGTLKGQPVDTIFELTVKFQVR